MTTLSVENAVVPHLDFSKLLKGFEDINISISHFATEGNALDVLYAARVHSSSLGLNFREMR